MASEDVQSQHVVTVNRSKVMLGTNDARMAAQRGWVRGCHIPGDASSGDFVQELNYGHQSPFTQRS